METRTILLTDFPELCVAVLEHGRLTEILYPSSAPNLGEHYIARIDKSAPGLDGAFAEIGGGEQIYVTLPRSKGVELRPDQCVEVEIVRPASGTKAARARIVGKAHGRPGLIGDRIDSLARALDTLTLNSVDLLVVDSNALAERARAAFSSLSEQPTVRVHDGPAPIFTDYNLEQTLEHLCDRELFLPSGGRITFDETEALTAIDVDTGRNLGAARNELVRQTNHEAAAEIAHQLRLRNIAGLLVIDFLRVGNASDRTSLLDAFLAASGGDRAQIRVGGFTRLGLFELSRQRIGRSVGETMREPCAACGGSGHQRTLVVRASRLARRMKATLAMTPEAAELVVTGPPLDGDLWKHTQATAARLGVTVRAEATGDSDWGVRSVIRTPR